MPYKLLSEIGYSSAYRHSFVRDAGNVRLKIMYFTYIDKCICPNYALVVWADAILDPTLVWLLALPSSVLEGIHMPDAGVMTRWERSRWEGNHLSRAAAGQSEWTIDLDTRRQSG